MPQSFGARIKKLRKDSGLSQEALAKSVGISATYLRKIENGERLPSGEITIRLAYSLGEDPKKWLLKVGHEKAEEKGSIQLIRHYQEEEQRMLYMQFREKEAFKLSKELRKIVSSYGENGLEIISEKTGIDQGELTDAIVRRRLRDSNWEKLHTVYGDVIPPPPRLWQYTKTQSDKQIPLIPHATPSEQAEIITDVWQIPVFDAGAGEPSSFSDSGYPVGEASEFVVVPRQGLDENSFAVTVHGDSMTPTLEQGDKCVVVPSAPLVNGKLCFASWSTDELGDRLIKRYRKTENTIILESDNRKYDPIILTEANGEGVRIFRVTQVIKDV